MKKVLLSAVALFAFGFANAQEEAAESTNGGFAKGDLFLSGAVGFGSESRGDNKSNGFEIAPRVGFFLTDNIALGAKLGFMSDKAEDATGDTVDMSSISAGLFGRYYMTPASQFSVFGEVGFDYMQNKDNLADTDSSSFAVGAGLGVNYFLADNWAIEASWAGLQFESDDNGGNGADATNSFKLGADLRSFGFGVLYKF